MGAAFNRSWRPFHALLRLVLWALAGLSAGAACADPPWHQTGVDDDPVVVVASSPTVQLNRVLNVRVQGLAAWRAVPGHSPWRLVPYINGRAILKTYPVAVNLETGWIRFHLRPNDDSREAWAELLTPLGFTREVGLSVGLELQDPLRSRFVPPVGTVQLVMVDVGLAAAAGGVMVCALLAFAALALRTSLLMELVTASSGDQEWRWSLSKVQLATWFFLIFGAFLVIWLVTGRIDTINASTLGTLGISAGTALGDAYTRSRQSSPLVSMESRPKPPWRRLGIELISDDKGYSIFRFQMAAWSLLLMVVFVADVLVDLIMPVFSPELLYLLGLSSGTFVAHRLPDVLHGAPGSKSTGAAPGAPPAPPAAPVPPAALPPKSG